MSMHPEMAQMAAQSLLSQMQPETAQVVTDTQAPLPPISQQGQQAQAAAKSVLDVKPVPEQSLPSQRQLQADDDAREAQLERDLREQDEAQVQGQGGIPLPPDLGQPAQADPENPGVVKTPEGLSQRAALVADNSHQAIDNSAATRAQHIDQAAQTEATIAKENQPNIEAVANKLQHGAADLERVKADVEQRQQQELNNYKQVNTEMMNMAVAQPKDLFESSGVNRVLGTLAVFLGGAGSNGFHENHALEQIKALADHNVAQQKMKYEMMSRVGEGGRTLYGMLNAKLSNAYTVGATIRNATIEAGKAQLEALQGKYADKRTRDAANSLKDKLTAEQVNANIGVEDHFADKSAQAMQLASQQEATRVRAYAIAAKSAGNQYTMPVAGFVGGVPKAEHPRLSKMVGGARTLVDGINSMEAIFEKGVKEHLTLEQTAAQVRQYFVGNALLFKGARDFLETGTRIEAGEQSIINAFKTDDKEAIFAILFGKDPAAMKAKLDASRRAVVAATYQQVKSAAPRTAALDSKDPLFGPYNPRTYKEDPQQFFTDSYKSFSGTPEGKSIIERAPAYTGGY